MNEPTLSGEDNNRFIGVAGWSIPARYAAEIPQAGSHLERYAHRLNAVEINSSFYRSHRLETYTRWAASTPCGFRFAVKVPRGVTHERRLIGCDFRWMHLQPKSAVLDLSSVWSCYSFLRV
ncbi:MAG: DUF72 domain-containing protein [Roseiarcus sp.]